MKLLRSLTLAAVLLVVGSTAATAQWGADWQETLKFKDGGSVAYNGVLVGPYHAWLTSVPGQPVIDIFCVDYSHEITNNWQWTANFEDLAHGNLAKTRLGYGLSGNDLLAVQTKYAEAAWLASQFKTAPTSSWGDIDYAIWNIMTPGTPLPNSATAGLILNAQNAVAAGAVNLAGWAVVTDVLARGETGGTQEYLTENPEPATMLLLGTGLLGLVAVGFVKRSSV